MAHQAQIGLGSNDRHRRGHALRLQVSLNMAETHSWLVERKKSCLDDCFRLQQSLPPLEGEEVREATWDLRRPRKSTEVAVAVEAVEGPPRKNMYLKRL